MSGFAHPTTKSAISSVMAQTNRKRGAQPLRGCSMNLARHRTASEPTTPKSPAFIPNAQARRRRTVGCRSPDPTIGVERRSETSSERPDSSSRLQSWSAVRDSRSSKCRIAARFTPGLEIAVSLATSAGRSAHSSAATLKNNRPINAPACNISTTCEALRS